MPLFDFNKTLSQSTDALKSLSALNPLTIRKKGTRAKAIFALSLVCILWGTTWLASKQGVKYIPDAIQMAGIRQLLGGICYVGFFLYKRISLPKGKEWIPILILSFLNFMISNGLSTLALQHKISAGLGAIIGAIFPLWLVVVGFFMSKERMPVMAIVGLLLGFGGVCIIFYDHLDEFLDPQFRLGILLSVIATWTWAIATLYTKRQAVRFNPYFGLGLQMVISGIVLYSFSSATGRAVALTAIPWQSWAAIAYLVIFGSLIAFVCYLYALQNLPTEQASIYAYINPIVAVVLGSVIFDEKLTVYLAIGGLVTLLGVYLVNKAYKITSTEQPETEGI
ncbi:MAG TPA: EamA family transporter [Chitinophagaceae bacterium]|jgi:drug/metabolite transporter (DMT)-like permease|nr:EamA family transporter [Chitinophagaceae bacterium]